MLHATTVTERRSVPARHRLNASDACVAASEILKDTAVDVKHRRHQRQRSALGGARHRPQARKSGTVAVHEHIDARGEIRIKRLFCERGGGREGRA